MTTTTTRPELTAMIRAERAALAEDLAELSAAQWASPSLCDRWSVEEVVAPTDRSRPATGLS